MKPFNIVVNHQDSLISVELKERACKMETLLTKSQHETITPSSKRCFTNVIGSS